MMKRITILLNVVILATAFGMAGLSFATPPGTAFTYQGRLIYSNVAADGLYDFQFSLYDVNTAGSQIGSDVNVPDINVIDGYFTVGLDFGSSVFDGNARWLEIGVIRHSIEYDPFLFTTLSPRQEITPTPYALYAKTASPDNDWMVSGNDIYSIPSGNVGIGTSTPLYPLHAVDTTPSSDVSAIYGEHAVTDYYGIGVQGVGLYKGVVGSVSATGSSTYYGVAGSADTSSSGGTSYGVYGSSSGGATSYGVFGVNYSNSYGVYGLNNNSGNYGYLGDPNYGVFGKRYSIYNDGNYGYLGGDYGAYGKYGGGGRYGYLGGYNYGVYGEYGNGGRYGYLGGYNYGVYGEYDSSSYGYLGGLTTGVYGRNNYTNGYAVYGSNGGSGTVGYLGGTNAVYGSNDSGTVGYLGGINGVYGAGNITHYAGYFLGNVWVTGNLSALSFTDRTPYPKDLATAYDAVMSMKRLPDGQYREDEKEMQLDHSKLSDFIRSKDGNRDLSAAVSALNEVVKDLIRKVKTQQQLIEIQNAKIQQMVETLQTNQQQPQISITKGAVQ